MRGYISGGGAANEGENGNVSEHHDDSRSRIEVRDGTRVVVIFLHGRDRVLKLLPSNFLTNESRILSYFYRSEQSNK